MATDPVQRVRSERRETAIDVNLNRPLQRMATFPPSSEVPYVTVRLDWRPDGANPRSRPARDIVERRLDEIVKAQPLRTPASEAMTEARDNILDFLDNELDPSAQGAYIVAGGEERTFVPLALGISIETDIAVGPVPVLTPLARMVEDHPAFGVLVTDQHQAHLLIVKQAVISRGMEVESNDYPRKQQQGGWSQQRFQARADERVSAFARTVAEETQRMFEQQGVDLLILAGDEVITSALDDAWHQTMKERIAAHIRIEITATESEIIDAALPVAIRAEREREQETAKLLANNVGGPMAVGGVEETLQALTEGRVINLVLNADFHEQGWADYSFPVAGVGEPRGEHPAGGDPDAMIPVALEEEMLRLALAQDADFEIVHDTVPIEEMSGEAVPQAGEPRPRTEAAEILDGMGGVGAILRYAVVDAGEGMAEGT